MKEESSISSKDFINIILQSELLACNAEEMKEDIFQKIFSIKADINN